MKKKKKKRIGIDRRNLNFNLIPDLKYPILESESIFDSQPYLYLSIDDKKREPHNIIILNSFYSYRIFNIRGLDN